MKTLTQKEKIIRHLKDEGTMLKQWGEALKKSLFINHKNY
jgi:hypothetical protein